MNNANSQTKTTYTVTWIYSEGVELTGKEVFESIDDVKSYVGRSLVADDGTLNVVPFRINTHTAE